jgi:hypothetical protein
MTTLVLLVLFITLIALLSIVVLIRHACSGIPRIRDEFIKPHPAHRRSKIIS